MLQSWVPLVVAVAYGGLLFTVAWWGDRRPAVASGVPSALVYSLALGVYCTSWTFFGAVGRATTNGWDYLAIYLGPILVFAVLNRVPARIIAISKQRRVTSIADFIAARYGKSHGLAVLISLMALMAVLPYIALQLKAVARSYGIMAGGETLTPFDGSPDTVALFIAAVLAVFTILFGTRQVDVTESHRGMVLAVAFESAVKLLAFTAVGLFVLFGVLDGPGDLVNRMQADATLALLWSSATLNMPFLVHMVLAMLAILCLPRQFHITVVENRDAADLRLARWAFPIYLSVFSVFVIPIAVAGSLGFGGADADAFVLTLPLAHGHNGLALLAFLGGFSAATAMVIVATIACSTMLCNEVIVPAMLRLRRGPLPEGRDLARMLLRIRRVLVVLIIGLGWVFFQLLGEYGALASMGLLAFVAVAQFGPALICGLYWKGATRAGALAGMMAGFGLWLYTLLIPAVIESGWLDGGWLRDGPLGLAWLNPYGLLGLSAAEPVTHGALWSLGTNLATLVTVSLMSTPGLLERKQAADFVGDGAAGDGRPGEEALPRLRGSATVGDLRILAERFVGRAKAEEAFRQHFGARGIEPTESTRCDAETMELAERLLAGAMGAAASRMVLASALKGGELQLEEVASIVGSASQVSRFNRDLLETTLENVPQGISVVDADLRLVAWNRTYAELFDYPRELLRVGTPVADLIRYNARLGRCGPGDPEEHVAKRVAYLAQGGRHSFQRQQGGRVLEMRQTPLPGGGFVTTFSDITEHKRVEAVLRESERNIRAYTDIVPVLIAYVDRDMRFRFINRAYESELGIPRGEIIGCRVDEVMSRERFVARETQMRAALAGRRQNFEVQLADGEGRVRWLEASYIPQVESDGTVLGFFAVFHEITERREAELALQETLDNLEQRVADRTQELSELNDRLVMENELRRGVERALREAKAEAEAANLSKTRFLAAASHDLLQPLNAARLFTSALGQREHDERTHAAIERIDTSLRAAEDLLATLLDISKLDAGALEPKVSVFSIEDVLDALGVEYGAMARERGIELSTVGSHAAVRSDRRFLRRIVQNFLSNALRYTPRGGRVVLGCRRRNGCLRIEVWDTGPGIPESRREEIFEEFRRLHPKDQVGEKGMGLGLAIARRMARTLDHRIDVRSWPGRGSVFSVEVPISREVRRPRQPGRRSKASTGALEGLLVVCVDNQPAILEGMVQLLETWGCEVLTAAGTAEALEVISARARHPDLVLADYHLEEGDTGLATIFAVRERYGHVAGAVITADHRDELKILARGAGLPLLRKPVKPAALRAMMGQLTARQRVAS